MAVRWTQGADKHCVPHEDAVHAMQNFYLVVDEFDEPRREGGARPDLYIGPPRTLGGPLLEVMVERVPPCDLVIFHVMRARAKFLALMDETDGE